MNVKQINDVKVKPYRGVDKRPYKYEALLPHPYCNILVIGPKNTGKSMICGSIIQNCITNRTVLRIYSSTMEADYTTSKTISKLQKRGITVEKFDGIQPGLLKEQLEFVKQYVENTKNKEKLLSYKYRFPLMILLWDDFRENFKKHPEISNFFSKNRHYLTLNILSSQRYKDIQTVARQNTQVLILTKGISQIVLKSIYEEQPLHISLEQFFKIYEFCTEGKYNFMFVDLENGKFRKNFDEEILF